MLLIPLWFLVFCLSAFWRLLRQDNVSSSSSDLVFVSDKEPEEDNIEEAKLKEEPEITNKAPEIETVITSSLWYCPYCDGANTENDLSCVHCGAPRKIS